jgi:hypothetical protein
MSDKYLEGKIRQTLDSFVRERNEALWSMDATKIKAFLRKWGGTIPKDNRVFWFSVCKAVLDINDTPEDVKATARQMLENLGMSEEIQ